MNTIITGDARSLAKTIPDGSVDLIFTDPPYHEKYLPLYAWLSEEAARVLKPGGFVLTYAGGVHKHQVMMSLGKHLTYFHDFISSESGPALSLAQKRVLVMHKSILAYSKGPSLPNSFVLSILKSPKRDKRFHKWGQSAVIAAYYIQHFSHPGETVWEPFTGGGTVPYVCKQLDRNFIAFEVDPKTAAIARKRLETVQTFLPFIVKEDTTQDKLWEASA